MSPKPKNCILIFPPNWSACVSAPHLAAPLLAGVAKREGWQAESWDLSELFYRTYVSPPSRSALIAAVREFNFPLLDRFYFDWEDQLRTHQDGQAGGFGLLSGYTFETYKGLPLVEVERLVGEGTIYEGFLNDNVAPELLRADPQVIGITIASQAQIIPAIELMQFVRKVLPNAFLVLGGNILTRLIGTSAFDVLTSLADQTVTFQGERLFARLLKSVGRLGVSRARRELPKMTSEESIPFEFWPTPDFTGIKFEQIVGTPALSYVSTRGCYWGKCHFCAIPAGWSRTGYGGSAPGDFAAHQLIRMTNDTGICRVKFVDEALPPSKVLPLSNSLRKMGGHIEWEAYARLEKSWQDAALLEKAREEGLTKLYFGLEQAPNTNREILGKNDQGDVMGILHACKQTGIKVHLFCMVGHPGSSREDAMATVQFLIQNEHLIDTADLVGFRLDRGTSVPGVRAAETQVSDWTMSLKYERTESNILSQGDVEELEISSQETIWDAVPRLLHPLYRIVGSWREEDLSTPKALDSHPMLMTV